MGADVLKLKKGLLFTGVKLDGNSIWKIHMDSFCKSFFFLICLNTYEL